MTSISHLISYNQNELHLLFNNPQNWTCPWRPSRSYIWKVFYKWKCNCFFLVFSRRCWSLLLVAKIIEWFTPRTTIILCCKNYVTHLWFLLIMIHFHYSLWNMSLEGVMSQKTNYRIYFFKVFKKILKKCA